MGKFTQSSSEHSARVVWNLSQNIDEYSWGTWDYLGRGTGGDYLGRESVGERAVLYI